MEFDGDGLAGTCRCVEGWRRCTDDVGRFLGTEASFVCFGSTVRDAIDGRLLGSVARANEGGDIVIYPGDYEMTTDVELKLSHRFGLEGPSSVLEQLPRQTDSCNHTVPVIPQ